MSFPPPKSAKPSGDPIRPPKSSPPAAKTPTPKAKPPAKSGPPISAAFHSPPPGAIPAMPANAPAAAPAPITQPGDVNSAYSRLDGRAIAQALLGQFAQAIAQPK